MFGMDVSFFTFAKPIYRPAAAPTRYAGAIRTCRSTPTLQYSITPRGRIRGRRRGQPARRSRAFCAASRSKSALQERHAPQKERRRSRENEALSARLSDPLAGFSEGIKGDGEDDNDADNDLLDIRRDVHQHETVE
jgi:hypothetical protein